MSNIKFLNKLWFLFAAVALISISSCNDDEIVEVGPDPIASFQFEIDSENWKQVNFSNFSQNATSYSWEFGDGGTSTEESPSYEYADAGTYTVTLTATNDDEVSVSKSEEIIITDPLQAERALIGESGKTWMLLADPSTGVNTFQVGPEDRSQVWWSLGGVEDPCVRECLYDDTWTFNTDGTFTFENNGDFWAEGGVWSDEMVGCIDATDPANFVGASGQDLSDWNSGTHNFTYDPSAGTLTVNGGFIGLTKAGTSEEVTEPQASVTYQVAKLVESDVDTLVLETAIPGGYWAFTLVSYNNTAPVVVEECEAVESVDVTFRLNWATYNGSATTPEVNGTFNNWCGNCNPMTDEDGDGIWEVTLNLPVGDHEFKFSADNWADQESLTEGDVCTTTNGDGFTNRTLTVGETAMTVGPVCWASCDDCPSDFTTEDLVGSWKMQPVAGALGVGPASGDVSWFANSEADVTTRDCYFDDVYTFNADGSFSITMDGSTWVEAWQDGVSEDGCGTPVAPHDGSGNYTYEATLNSIKVNGEGAFIGLAKAVNEGELSNGVAVPTDVTYTITGYSVSGNGTKFLSLEIESGAGVFWQYKLTSVQ